MGFWHASCLCCEWTCKTLRAQYQRAIGAVGGVEAFHG